ncbi:MAG: hypothetical protein AAF216_02680 [Pseudomonadota bacterium]
MSIIRRVAAVAAFSALSAVSIGTAAFAQIVTTQGDTISDSAAVYATFQADVTDVKTSTFDSTGDIETSLRNLGGQNASQLTGGFIAYSALVASQDPEFRASVRDIEGFYGRESLLLGLANDVRYARQLEGGTSAVTSSLSAVAADSRRLRGAGAYVKEQAYTLQGTGWAKSRFSNKDSVLDHLSTGTGRPVSAGLRAAFADANIDNVLIQAGQSGAPSLWDGVNSAASAIRFPTLSIAYSGNTTRVAAGRERVADQIATLAAYRVLGSSTVAAGTVRQSMTETQTRNCFQTARLNLQQCVAAVHQHHEAPFCIGEHALTEIGDCIGDITQ